MIRRNSCVLEDAPRAHHRIHVSESIGCFGHHFRWAKKKMRPQRFRFDERQKLRSAGCTVWAFSGTLRSPTTRKWYGLQAKLSADDTQTEKIGRNIIVANLNTFHRLASLATVRSINVRLLAGQKWCEGFPLDGACSARATIYSTHNDVCAIYAKLIDRDREEQCAMCIGKW